MNSSFIPKIAIFTYDFPHWKSESILEDCILKKLDVGIVLAAPKIDLNTGKLIDSPLSQRCRELCETIFKNLIPHLIEQSKKDPYFVRTLIRMSNSNDDTEAVQAMMILKVIKDNGVI